MMINKIKERDSNFELLRIFAMFLIVLFHVCGNGVFSYWHNNSSQLDHINNFFCFLLAAFGEVGVTLFILISGYFSCQQKFRPQKWFNIYFQTFFISVLIFIFFSFWKPEVAINAIAYSFCPFLTNTYWFITSFLLLYAFSPLLNILLKNCSQKMLQLNIIAMTIFWVVLPSIFGVNLGVNLGYSSLIYFMYLYILGGCYRLNYLPQKSSFFFYPFLIVIIYFLFYTASYFLSVDKVYLWDFRIGWGNLNSAFTLIVSLWIFHVFANLKIKSSLINWLATSMFGVYLLHDNYLIRKTIWYFPLKMDWLMTSPYFVIFALFISLSVFGICIILDKLISFFLTPFVGYFIETANQVIRKILTHKSLFRSISKE